MYFSEKEVKKKNPPKVKTKRKRSDSDQSDPDDPSPKPKGRRKAPAGKTSKRRKVTEDTEVETDDPLVSSGPTPLNLFALGFEENEAKPLKVGKTFMTQQDRLASNVASGKANENYQKIDLKKKSYSKGKRTGEFLKKMDFKRKLAAKVGFKVLVKRTKIKMYYRS